MRKRVELNYFQKFVFGIILAGILPITAFVTIIMTTYFRDYQKVLAENYLQASQYASESLDGMVEAYDDALKLFYDYKTESNLGNKEVLSILDGSKYGGLKAEELREQKTMEMQMFLRSVVYSNSYIEDAFFITAQEDQTTWKIYTESRRATHLLYGSKDYTKVDAAYMQGQNEKFLESIDLPSIQSFRNQLCLIPPQAVDYFTNLRNDELYLGVARNFTDLSGMIGEQKYQGTLYLNVSLNGFEKTFSNMDIYRNGSIYVVDGNGFCIYSNHSDEIGQVSPEYLNKIDADDSMDFVVSQEMRNTDWTIIFALENDTFLAGIRQLQITIYVVAALCILGLILFSVLFSHKLTNPIRLIMNEMAKVEKGDFDVQLKVGTNDEIGKLSQRFNEMSKELKEYIDKSFHAQLRQKEAELSALKSQIYPHFLYNTLEVIRMTALANHDEKVSDMIEALSDQIRYVIGTVKDKVPLSLEVDILYKYIFLLNCRYEDKVDFTVNIHGLKSYMIPKLILQPLIENAFVHGIKPKEGRGHIRLDGKKENDAVIISVIDNGVGMSREVLAQVKELIDGVEPGRKKAYQWESIGLKNVHDRIRYLYGEAYGLQISSDERYGTRMKIVMPYNEK